MKATRWVWLLGFPLLVACSKAKVMPESSAGEAAGVAECEEYFRKARECFADHAAAKARMEGPLKQMREALDEIAASPGGEEQVRAQCKRALPLLVQSCQ
jgi:hypothetical protein